MATCGLVWLGPLGSGDTHIFQDLLQAGHAEDGDPDGHHGAQEVTVLQGVVVHDAHHSHARLITRVVELGTKAKVSVSPAAPQGLFGEGRQEKAQPTSRIPPVLAPGSSTKPLMEMALWKAGENRHPALSQQL